MGQEEQKIMEELAAHIGTVRRRIAELLRSRPQEIDDCVQETMLEACRSVERHGAPTHPKAWLKRIAEHMSYRGANRCRRRQGVETALSPHHGAAPGTILEEIAKTDQAAQLRKAVEMLPDGKQGEERLPRFPRDTLSNVAWFFLGGRKDASSRASSCSERSPVDGRNRALRRWPSPRVDAPGVTNSSVPSSNCVEVYA